MESVFPIILDEPNKEMTIFLKDRFMELCPLEKEWDNLLRHYQDGQRAYHNLSHIYSMFTKWDTMGLEMDSSLEYAIWYHDIIYDSKAKDNEQQSADFFRQAFLNVMDGESLDRVTQLILSTQKHFPLLEADELNPLMLDLDLFILSAPSDLYGKYSAAIRKEYAWVPNELYRIGRTKVLESFLERSRIYFSNVFFELHETDARHNLELELNRFKSQQ